MATPNPTPTPDPNPNPNPNPNQVRFAYRQDTNKRAKILRNVTFPEVLDIRNLCATKLKAGTSPLYLPYVSPMSPLSLATKLKAGIGAA